MKIQKTICFLFELWNERIAYHWTNWKQCTAVSSTPFRMFRIVCSHCRTEVRTPQAAVGTCYLSLSVLRRSKACWRVISNWKLYGFFSPCWTVDSSFIIVVFAPFDKNGYLQMQSIKTSNSGNILERNRHSISLLGVIGQHYSQLRVCM